MKLVGLLNQECAKCPVILCKPEYQEYPVCMRYLISAFLEASNIVSAYHLLYSFSLLIISFILGINYC